MQCLLYNNFMQIQIWIRIFNILWKQETQQPWPKNNNKILHNSPQCPLLALKPLIKLWVEVKQRVLKGVT